VQPVAGPVNVDLDYDGTWVLSGNDFPNQNDLLWGLPVRGGVATTFFSIPHGGSPMLDFTIDRDPGAWPYATVRNSMAPWIESADRKGFLSTIAVAPSTIALGGRSITFEPRLGSYLVTISRVMRVSRQGSVRTINSTIGSPGDTALLQDGTAWIGAVDPQGPVSTPILYRIDQQGVVISVVRFPYMAGYLLTGIAVYGERRMVCAGSGRPGTQVSVNLQSRRPGDGSKPYVLGCSFARRPGIPVPGGNMIDLNPQSLLFLSAGGLAPGVFRGFQGVTDSMGNAAASVHIPAGLPPGLGITVFIVGAIYDATGIRTVTNTHWFVLN
jgi:hypothetical protein